jgi:hypothetical protein
MLLPKPLDGSPQASHPVYTNPPIICDARNWHVPNRTSYELQLPAELSPWYSVVELSGCSPDPRPTLLGGLARMPPARQPRYF